MNWIFGNLSFILLHVLYFLNGDELNIQMPNVTSLTVGFGFTYYYYYYIRMTIICVTIKNWKINHYTLVSKFI